MELLMKEIEILFFDVYIVPPLFFLLILHTYSTSKFQILFLSQNRIIKILFIWIQNSTFIIKNIWKFWKKVFNVHFILTEFLKKKKLRFITVQVINCFTIIELLKEV